MGELANIADAGIPIFIFTGNHDLWYKDYFPRQIGATIFEKPIIRDYYGKSFYIAHGDGLGPGDIGYKILKSILTNPICKWLFERLHPNFGIGLANISSGWSRYVNDKKDPMETYKGKRENLFIHAKNMMAGNSNIDFFVFGHRHVVIEEKIEDKASLIILGDWIRHFTYLSVGPDEIQLKSYPMD